MSIFLKTKAQQYYTTTTSSLSMTLPSQPAIGDQVLVAVFTAPTKQTATPSITGVTGWVSITENVGGWNGEGLVASYTLLLGKVTSTPGTTLTVSLSKETSSAFMVYSEWSGLSSTVVAENNELRGYGSPASCNTLTATTANETLLLSAVTTPNAAITSVNFETFNELGGLTSNEPGYYLAYRLVATTNTYTTPQYSLNSNTTFWDGCGWGLEEVL